MSYVHISIVFLYIIYIYTYLFIKYDIIWWRPITVYTRDILRYDMFRETHLGDLGGAVALINGYNHNVNPNKY